MKADRKTTKQIGRGKSKTQEAPPTPKAVKPKPHEKKTERKRAEKDLRESEERFHALIENASDAIALISADGTILYESQAVASLLGYAVGERTGRAFFELIHPDDLPDINNRFAQLLQKPDVKLDAELRYRHKDGSWRWLESIGQNLLAEPDVQAIVVNYRDITEPKQAKAALRESEGIHRLVLDNVDEIVYLVEMGTDNMFTNQVRFVSGRVEQILGYQPEEFIHDRDLWFRIIHPDDAPALAERTRAIFASGQPGMRAYRMRHKRTGDYHWLEDHVVPQLDAAGVVIGQFGVARDVTELRKVEAALHASEKRFRALIENASDVVALVSANGTILYESSALTRVLGYAVEERTDRAFFELVHPDDFSDITNRFAQLLQQPDVTISTQFRYRHKDGSWRWLEGTGHNLLAEPGVQAIVANYRDITEQKRAEDSLRESEERYRLLVELSPVAIFVHSHGALLFANACGAAMLGAAHPGELMGKSVLDFIHPAHRHELAMRAGQIEQVGNPRHQEETQFVAADGRTVYAEVSSAPITYRGQAARLVIVKDISKRRQAEKELAERSRLLEAFFANTLTSIALLDRDFNFVRVNEAYARAGARDVSDFPGHNHFEFYPSDAQAIFEDVVKTKKSFQIFARPFVFPDHPDWGTTYWDWTLVPILDNAGEVEFLVFTLNDVSERVMAEAERRKLASAIEQTDAGVMIVNRQGIIEFVNAAFERIAGHSRQDPLGQIPSALQSGAHSKEFYAGLWRTINAGESFHSVFTDKTKEGKHIHVDQTISPIKDAQGSVTHFVSVWKDITEQVQAEQERERLFEQAQAGRERLRNLSQQLLDVQETERRRIALELHDEIGQTLTGLRLSLELPARLPVEAATARLAQARTMVDELLRYVENLALDLRPSILDDLGLLPALLWQIERYSTRTGMRVNCKHTGLDRRFPPEIETAAFRIVQEALTNTARHAGVDDVTVRLWATPEILGLQVEDGGSGFDPKEALSVGATSGLSGMRERALLSGGRFEIESEPGNGTRLTVELPLGGQLEKREQS